jgi:hypothetical protein
MVKLTLQILVEDDHGGILECNPETFFALLQSSFCPFALRNVARSKLYLIRDFLLALENDTILHPSRLFATL